MAEVSFKGKKVNRTKLSSFGFESRENGFRYSRKIVDGQMRVTLFVSLDGKVSAEVRDGETGDEYVLHRIPEASGSFVGRVKEEYEATLDEFIAKCCDNEAFGVGQSEEVIAYIRKRYGDELEFLWENTPDNAVVRRRDNRKWYAAFLTVSRRKLGLETDERAEIVDIRMSPEEVLRTVDGKRYFPGYHMNKRHWVTVCLDGTLPSGEICRRIDDSYLLAGKK